MNWMRIGALALTRLGLPALVCAGAFAQGPPEILWQRDDHTASVLGIGFTEDGGQVVSGAQYPDSSFRIWSAADGSPQGAFSLAPHSIHSVAAIPRSPWIAVGYVVSGYPPGGEAAVWDVQAGFQRFTAGGSHVAVSPDGALLASGGGGVNRYLAISRVADGAKLHSIYTGSYLLDVAFSPDASVVATAGSDNAARLWNPQTGALVRVIPAHQDDVSALAFSPDGRLLATGAGGWDPSDDSTVKIWRVADGALLRTFEGHGDWVYALAFSPDGDVLLSAGRDGSQGDIRFWSLPDGGLVRWYQASAQEVAFSPDGGTFAYGGAFSEVVLAVNPTHPTDGSGRR